MRNLKIAALVSAIAHTFAALFMAFVLSPGILSSNDFYPRVEYIKANTQGWQLGWSVWIFAAFAFLAFTLCARRHHLALNLTSRILLRNAVICAFIAVLLDLHAELGQIFYVVELVNGEGPMRKDFLLSQFRFMFESGTVANFSYCLATRNIVIATRDHYPKWIVKLGYLVFGVGFLASGFALIATFCYDHHVNPMRDLLVLTNGILFPLLVFWQLGIAYKSKGENHA